MTMWSVRVSLRGGRPAAARVLAAGGTPGSGLSLLQASKALPRKGVGCKNPTKPVPLRRTPAGPADVVVELVTCATCTGAPACPLPQQLDPPQELAQGGLLALDTLQPLTLVLRLCQLEHRMGALAEEQRRALATCPAFAAFMERALEVVCQRGMGPAAPVLILCVLSLLRFDNVEPQQQLAREGWGRFHRHLAAALEDAIKRESGALTPQAVLQCYESWAALDLGSKVVPLKSSLVGLKLRECLRGSKLSSQECLRLLVAIAGIHRKSEGAFSPSNYDVSDTISGLVHGIRLLRPAELAAAAAACSAFDWPVYRSPLWALDCIAQETIRRLHTEALPALEAEDLLRGAVEAAAAIRPRLGSELEGRIEAWDLQALASAATLHTAQAMMSWAEAEEAASTLNNIVASTLNLPQPLAGRQG